MNFLIHGVNFNNKGSELMLYAVKQQADQWNYNCYLELKFGSFEQRKQAGIGHFFWLKSNKIPFAGTGLNIIGGLTPKSIRKNYNILLESEIDVVIDASGLAFSEQWGSAVTESVSEKFFRWKKQGKKIILLPQAFGPFTSNKIKKAFTKIIENVDLIFPRDQISYDYVSQLSIPTERVKIAPDFTNLVSGIEPLYIDKLINKPCIVPNCRMIDKTSTELGNNYISFLKLSIQYLLEKGLEPFILIHEVYDAQLAEELQFNYELPIVKEENPLFLKGIIGKCNFMIGSRFHGLVSSLSQGIPCIGTGWSHKYQMLFQDYNCSELLININENVSKNLQKIDLLLDESTRNKIVKKIEFASQRQKILSNQMWNEVAKELGV
ncbi:polysaccharide pyruvyl transferase family protein [Anabaena sp. CCY 9402-a]|uniref:polysaccharide pyruvyl transferase family protein n=1 Tax=Anabaena sp. CCY 9402-a TaxID=3103867 RepID=UPI0039C6016F